MFRQIIDRNEIIIQTKTKQLEHLGLTILEQNVSIDFNFFEHNNINFSELIMKKKTQEIILERINKTLLSYDIDTDKQEIRNKTEQNRQQVEKIYNSLINNYFTQQQLQEMMKFISGMFGMNWKGLNESFSILQSKVTTIRQISFRDQLQRLEQLENQISQKKRQEDCEGLIPLITLIEEYKKIIGEIDCSQFDYCEEEEQQQEQQQRQFGREGFQIKKTIMIIPPKQNPLLIFVHTIYQLILFSFFDFETMTNNHSDSLVQFNKIFCPDKLYQILSEEKLVPRQFINQLGGVMFEQSINWVPKQTENLSKISHNRNRELHLVDLLNNDYDYQTIKEQFNRIRIQFKLIEEVDPIEHLELLSLFGSEYFSYFRGKERLYEVRDNIIEQLDQFEQIFFSMEEYVNKVTKFRKIYDGIGETIEREQPWIIPKMQLIEIESQRNIVSYFGIMIHNDWVVKEEEQCNYISESIMKKKYEKKCNQLKLGQMKQVEQQDQNQ
ncbi:hypothetical protein ABPG72_015448 [Tetrahymena utriculariae]